ncbi:molybdopterin molybdotransferase MoeA [Gramella sp. GC03-9]|uniref:Molybdopterin molybdenumtransferase n=1 Tax=Christiangramia oceanisediminis TaxID=2920386 RepID=A0A9X2KW86_9FLAO|nr:gephyrin-like molybdotransferase Glp [Gramella oceanisediminis]MCP9199962.1 molybdopterin molybdotransferase MoeA [Gramella oceanisediminis]
MVSIQEAFNIIRNQDPQLKTEFRNLDDCLGFNLAEAVKAPFDMPSFDNSAMDGYALCGNYSEYTVTGEVAAGDIDQVRLKDGEAVRIFTGARVPAETTAVIMQEKVKRENDRIVIEGEIRPGQCIRRQGEEFKKGDPVFEEGFSINPAAIGLLGSLGIARVRVFKQPVVHLIATGNELIEPGTPKKAGHIYESNSHALSAACEQFGFSCASRVQIEDDLEKIRSGIAEALKTCDVLILSGGISVGDYDYVKQALEENGVQEQFYKVFQKPGKPLYFGRRENSFVFALPGNPASSLSCFYMYVLPFLQLSSGSNNAGLPKIQIPALRDIENKGDRPCFLKARIKNNSVEISGGQSSSMIRSMALSNALAYIDAGTLIKKGEAVTCYLIS